MKLRMKEIRILRGLKQTEVADLVGMPTRRYGSYERMEREISLADAAAIADVLECSLDELAGREWPSRTYADERQERMNEDFEALSDPGKSHAFGAVRGIRDAERA